MHIIFFITNWIERIAQTITTKVPGCYSPEKKLQSTKLKDDKPEISPAEFKLLDNRVDYVVDKGDNIFDDINDRIVEQDSELETDQLIGTNSLHILSFINI